MLFRLVVIPMTLFSGTFFPVDRLPVWVQPVAWVSPLWHGTELARAAPRWTGGRRCPRSGTSAYLVALLALGVGAVDAVLLDAGWRRDPA